jgi:hypothetical protein
VSALPYDQRPADNTPIHTADLPPTPIRDRNIPATAWIEAPASVLDAGGDLPGAPVAGPERGTPRTLSNVERGPARRWLISR